jgi:hydroxyacylglutathione hydrolase
VSPGQVVVDRRRYRTDNYVYLLTTAEDALLVDPGDPDVALALADAHGVRPRAVLHTHGHPDHTGGTAEVVRRTGARVFGSGADAGWYPPDEDVRQRDALAVGGLRLRIHHVPGHTAGSVAYEWEGCLFTGDTLFWGGAGNCKHGGDPRTLAESFLGPIAALDGALLVHPGHDYAEANLPFALELEPDHREAAERLSEVRAARARGEEPPPSTLARERRVNPFLRADALRPVLARRGLACRDPADAFVAIRRLRDGWRG